MNFSDPLKFSFGRLTSTVSDATTEWQLLLGITADFVILFGDREFYREVEFPVVEFGAQAVRWMHDTGGDFEYVSMESEEQALLAFRTDLHGELLPYSPHQEFAVGTPIRREALARAIGEFVERLRVAARSELSLNLDSVL